MLNYGLLRAVPLFSTLTDCELEKLGAIAEKRHYQKNEAVFLQGEKGRDFFIILSGSVKVSIQSPHGREITLSILAEGDFFGEMSLIDGSSRSASVYAIVRTEVITVGHDSFNAYLSSSPEVSIKLLRLFIKRLRHADRQIEYLAFHTTKGRLARMILDWVVDYGNISLEGVSLTLPFTHREIAGMLGASRESVSRILTEFRDSGYIQLDGDGLTVHDLEGLRKMGTS